MCEIASLPSPAAPHPSSSHSKGPGLLVEGNPGPRKFLRLECSHRPPKLGVVARNLTPNLIKRLGHNAGEFLRADGRCALNPRLQDTLRPIPSLKLASGVENPGEVLERAREQLEGGDQANELEERL